VDASAEAGLCVRGAVAACGLWRARVCGALMSRQRWRFTVLNLISTAWYETIHVSN
jgi:hypothetical protein